MDIKEQIAKIEELYKSQGCYYYSGDDMPVHVDDCRVIGCVSCIIKTILAIPELVALLKIYEQAGRDITLVVVKAENQDLPEIRCREDGLFLHPVKDTRVLLIELKSDKGKTSEHQEVWRNALTPAVAEGKVEYYLFRPEMRDKITEILKGEL